MMFPGASQISKKSLDTDPRARERVSPLGVPTGGGGPTGARTGWRGRPLGHR